jgi:hypothetical protein
MPDVGPASDTGINSDKGGSGGAADAESAALTVPNGDAGAGAESAAGSEGGEVWNCVGYTLVTRRIPRPHYLALFSCLSHALS